MWDDLGLFLGLVFLMAGTLPLYDGASGADTSETAAVVGGAALLSLGVVTTWTVLKNWWTWRKEYERYRNE